VNKGWIIGCVLSCAVAAHAGGVVALTDGRVAPYREAMTGAREVLGGSATVVDVAAPDAAAQLQKAQPTVVLAVGQKALDLAKAESANVATVFCMVMGSSNLHSRTVTGVRLEVSPAQQLEQLKLVHPRARRVGVIYEPHGSGALVDEAVKAAGRLGLTLVARSVPDAKGVRPALLEIADGIDALLLIPDPHLITSEMFGFLLSFTLERKIALFGFLDSFSRAGALASIAAEYSEIGRRAAKLALEIAGKPESARLPVPAPVSPSGSLTVNIKTARRLGIDLPAAVTAKARQVYE
jgi:putative tryptophan/tyrosine transport system substrate-binding protein